MVKNVSLTDTGSKKYFGTKKKTLKSNFALLLCGQHRMRRNDTYII